MRERMLSMLRLQDEMNRRVNQDWVEAGYPWYRAIWTECAEMLDHYGWKWWKHQEPDMEQVCLEIIDIWHFVLSDVILAGKASRNDLNRLAGDLEKAFLSVEKPVFGDLRDAIEHMALRTLENRRADVEAFVNLCNCAGLGSDDLYTRYVGKNVLNFFRQDHGYKDGSYVKEWGGREDNEHLSEIVSTLDPGSPDFQEELYRELEARYTQWIRRSCQSSDAGL